MNMRKVWFYVSFDPMTKQWKSIMADTADRKQALAKEVAQQIRRGNIVRRMSARSVEKLL